MDFIIVFFRDILDGPLYYVIVSICSILICSCIGYMGERYLKQKKEIEEKMNTHADANQVQAGGQAPQQTLSPEEAEKALRAAVAPQEQKAEPVQAIAEMPVEGGNEETSDPNQEVNYNVANVGTDELLDDD